MKKKLIFLLAFAASSASAQMRVNTPDDGTLNIQLPAGKVEVTMNQIVGHGLILHAGGDKELLLESARMPEWLEVYGNSVLLRLHMGTAACEASHIWVTYDERGLRATDEFGTCAYDGKYSVTADGPTYTMEGETRSEVTTTFLFRPSEGKIIAIPQSN